MTKPTTNTTTKEQNAILAFAVIVGPFAGILCGLAGFFYLTVINPIESLLKCRSMKDVAGCLIPFFLFAGIFITFGGIHEMHLGIFLTGVATFGIACGLTHLYPDTQ